MKIKNKIFTALALITIAGGAAYFTANPKVATVGDYSIYKNDVACRDAVISVNYPDDKRKLGLFQLTQSYKYAQILKNFHQMITKDQITKEKKRIDQSTLMPEKLAEIKTACGGDGITYENAFVLPTLADRVIYYEFFLKNPTIHRDVLKEAQDWYNQIKNTPEQFERLAKKENHMVSLFTVSLARGLEWEQPKNEHSPTPAGHGLLDGSGKAIPIAIQKSLEKDQQNKTSREGEQWIAEIIAPLKPGQISPRVIDQGEVFLLVKYLKKSSKEKNTFHMQANVFPKINFGTWLDAQMKLVRVDPLLSWLWQNPKNIVR